MLKRRNRKLQSLPAKDGVMSRLAIVALVMMALGPAACASSQPQGGSASSVGVTASTSTAARLRPCRAEVSACKGELFAGTYSSTNTDLFSTGRSGQISVTVPQGWANTLDHQPAYWLRPTQDYYADPATDGNGTSSGIYVWGDVAAARQGGPCAEISDPTVRTDARSLAKWMRSIKGVSAKPLPSESLSGLPATMLDLELGADPPQCDGSPYAVLIASRPGAPDAYGWGMGKGEQARLWLLDLGGGHTAGVFVIGPKATFGTLLRRAQPILATLKLANT